VTALFEAGCRNIEAGSFVSERAVPAMAGAAEVIDRAKRAGLSNGTILTALVPNLKGAEGALAAGVSALTVTISASPAYNEKNVRMTVDSSLSEIRTITDRASQARVPVDAVVSCAFGSPYDEEIEPADVARLAAELGEAGCSALTLADTTGVASPRRVHEVLAALDRQGGRSSAEVGLHLHDTRGTALVNAWAALEAGVRRFDTSVGGLGGSPFAPGAGGNLATEDLVALLDDVGVETGISLAGLVRAGRLLRELVGHELESRTMAALGGRREAY
jgi:hydroxymethylglutaryl-CoA lyase